MIGLHSPVVPHQRKPAGPSQGDGPRDGPDMAVTPLPFHNNMLALPVPLIAEAGRAILASVFVLKQHRKLDVIVEGFEAVLEGLSNRMGGGGGGAGGTTK